MDSGQATANNMSILRLVLHILLYIYIYIYIYVCVCVCVCVCVYVLATRDKRTLLYSTDVSLQKASERN